MYTCSAGLRLNAGCRRNRRRGRLFASLPSRTISPACHARGRGFVARRSGAACVLDRAGLWFGQGFHLSRPVPVEEIPAVVARASAPSSAAAVRLVRRRGSRVLAAAGPGGGPPF